MTLSIYDCDDYRRHSQAILEPAGTPEVEDADYAVNAIFEQQTIIIVELEPPK